MATPRKSKGLERRSRPKATTPEARENQLISLAYDLAEQQMIEGTASAMVITHYLKLGTTRSKLEEEKLRKENLLLTAKTDSYQSAQKAEVLYEEAIKAIRAYQGDEVDEDDEELHGTQWD